MLKSSLLAFTRIQYDCIIRIGSQKKELYVTGETENCTSTTTLLYEQIIDSVISAVKTVAAHEKRIPFSHHVRPTSP